MSDEAERLRARIAELEKRVDELTFPGFGSLQEAWNTFRAGKDRIAELERECDEWITQHTINEIVSKNLLAKVAELERERDELREELVQADKDFEQR